MSEQFINMGSDESPILVTKPGIIAENGGIVRQYVINTDDLKRVRVVGNTITEIKKKRRGTYGHRGKEGARFFGRETQVIDYENPQ